MQSRETQIADVQQLLYQEADLLDRPDLDRWLELYTEDGTYWMPASVDQPDPLNHISIFYDDRVLMEVRKRNFKHPRAASKDYAVRSSHLISNVQITEHNARSGDCTVTSNFHCFMFYNNKQTPFAGKYTHQLVRHDGGYRIRHKKVELINCDAAHDSIIIYI